VEGVGDFVEMDIASVTWKKFDSFIVVNGKGKEKVVLTGKTRRLMVMHRRLRRLE